MHAPCTVAQPKRARRRSAGSAGRGGDPVRGGGRGAAAGGARRGNPLLDDNGNMALALAWPSAAAMPFILHASSVDAAPCKDEQPYAAPTATTATAAIATGGAVPASSCCCGFFLWPLAGKKGGKTALGGVWCYGRSAQVPPKLLSRSFISASFLSYLSFIGALSQLYRSFIEAFISRAPPPSGVCAHRPGAVRTRGQGFTGAGSLTPSALRLTTLARTAGWGFAAAERSSVLATCCRRNGTNLPVPPPCPRAPYP